jgi:hypothetical protein
LSAEEPPLEFVAADIQMRRDIGQYPGQRAHLQRIVRQCLDEIGTGQRSRGSFMPR